MPVGSPSAQHIERWAKRIASDSKGRLKVQIFPSNTLIPGPEIYDAVKTGTVDLGFSWRYKPAGFDIGVALPFLLGAPNTLIGSRVYDDIWRKFPKAMAEEWKGVKILYLVPSVPNYLASRKELRKVDDIKGQQIRVPSPEFASFIKELGGTPAFMSSGDFIIGLDKGVVDGAVLLSAMIADYKLGGKIKDVIMDPTFGLAGPVFLAMNEDSYNRLPADLKGVLDKSCEWAKEDALKYWTATMESAKNYCKTSGIQMIYLKGEEKQKLVTVYERTCDKIGKDLDAKGRPGTELVRFIRERVKQYTQ